MASSSLPDVMEEGESNDERWSTSFRREIRRQQREVLNDVHSKEHSIDISSLLPMSSRGLVSAC